MSDSVLLSTTGPVKTDASTARTTKVHVRDQYSDPCELEVVEVKGGKEVSYANRRSYWEKGNTKEAMFYLQALGRVNQCQNKVSIVYYSAK